MKRKIAFLISILLWYGLVFGQQSNGHLVIVGGALADDNAAVYSQMIDLAGGPDKASFAVIPSASGVAMQSWVSISKTLQSYGVKPENIHLIKIAVMDDDSTTDVDESKWAENGKDPAIAAQVKACSAIWFTGGDQMRTMKALKFEDGKNTPVLDAVWAVYKRGGLIGGSSAGAAIMSEVMIGNGTSLGALQLGIIQDNGPENEDTDALLLTHGMGFFPEGIVDQHFNQRARIGRLIMALTNSKEKFNLAFGVDENTALIYSAAERTIKVAGGAGLTIVNAKDAEITYHQGLPDIKNLSLSYLENGDEYIISTGELIPAKDKKTTQGNENYNRKRLGQAGILSANRFTLRDAITINLMDSKAVESFSNLNFTDEENAFLLTFTKKASSKGYYYENLHEEDKYAVSDIRMDISPVKVTITKK